jgi:purine nucleoside phosphorylase
MGRPGASAVLLTNAWGREPGSRAGTLMIIADHLNLTGRISLLERTPMRSALASLT